MHISTGNKSKMVTGSTNVTIVIRNEVAYGFTISIYTFDLCPFCMSRSNSCIFHQEISQKWGQVVEQLLLSSDMKSHIGLLLTCLGLTLAHSRGQGQTHFDGISLKW